MNNKIDNNLDTCYSYMESAENAEKKCLWSNATMFYSAAVDLALSSLKMNKAYHSVLTRSVRKYAQVLSKQGKAIQSYNVLKSILPFLDFQSKDRNLVLVLSLYEQQCRNLSKEPEAVLIHNKLEAFCRKNIMN